MTNKLEEVARVIAAAVNADIAPHICLSNEGATMAARAAVEALRVPTAGMNAAITVSAWRSGSGVEPASVCRAMIDAILNEKP